MDADERTACKDNTVEGRKERRVLSQREQNPVVEPGQQLS